MKKGTKITHKAYPFNEDGDHEINLPKTPPLSEEEYNAIFDDPEHFFVHIGKGKMYGVNKLNFKGRRFTILEPNPVTFYFSLAMDAQPQIEHAHLQLENSLNNSKSSWPIEVSYSYIFRVSALFVITAFTACEAFLNQHLPDFKEIQLSDGRLYSKEDIIYFFFDKKLDTVNSYTGKNFSKAYPHKMKRLIFLKNLRNDLIHLKEKQGVAASYNVVYQNVLDLDIRSLINTVKSFINYYEPKLIINYNYTSGNNSRQ
jgi:hypothetical protein